jgi:hypothetical protein
VGVIAHTSDSHVCATYTLRPTLERSSQDARRAVTQRLNGKLPSPFVDPGRTGVTGKERDTGVFKDPDVARRF